MTVFCVSIAYFANDISSWKSYAPISRYVGRQYIKRSLILSPLKISPFLSVKIRYLPIGMCKAKRDYSSYYYIYNIIYI